MSSTGPGFKAHPVAHASIIVALGPEGAALGDLLASSVPYARFQMSDNNKVLIAVHGD